MNLDELLERLGVKIDRDLLKLALTHSSYAYEKGGANNERLEFLGDSLVGFIITDHIYQTQPNLSEGELTKLKNAVVSAVALSAAAIRLGLGEFLLLGRGEEQTQGRLKPNLLADAFEALLGAAFLSGGMALAEKIVIDHVVPLLSDPDAIREAADPKTSLVERFQKSGEPVPHYEISFEGPDHDRQFFAVALSGSLEIGRGSGTTKRGAETQAAIAALRGLNA